MQTRLSIKCKKELIRDIADAIASKLIGLDGFSDFRINQNENDESFLVDINHDCGLIETIHERMVEVCRVINLTEKMEMRVSRIEVDDIASEDLAEIIIRRRGATQDALMELLSHVNELSRRIDIGGGNFEAAKLLFDAINLSHVLDRICTAIRRPDIMDDARESTQENLAKTNLIKVH